MEAVRSVILMWGDGVLPDPSGALDLLQRGLEHEDGLVRWKATAMIADGAPAEDRFLPGVCAVLQEADTGARRIATAALGRYGPRAAVALADLRAALFSDVPPHEVLRTLAARGPAAVAALPDVLARAGHPDVLVRQHVLRTLGAIGAPTPEVLRTLERIEQGDDRPEVRELAATVRVQLLDR